MSKQEFLNFAEISKVPFQGVLDALNIPYTIKKRELHGDGFIVNLDKNLFFMPKDDSIKGSPINFLAHYKNITLREAASELKKQFLTKETEPQRAIPNLILEWDSYIQGRGIPQDIATEYEIGLVKQRSVMSGRIAFKIYDHEGKHTGYVGYKVKDNTWFFPKGFKRTLYNVHRLTDAKTVTVTTDPFDALRLVSLGVIQVTSLLALSMTTEQEEQLRTFSYILLLHPEPHNIMQRLYNSSFVKAPVLSKPIKDMTNEELQALI